MYHGELYVGSKQHVNKAKTEKFYENRGAMRKSREGKLSFTKMGRGNV